MRCLAPAAYLHGGRDEPKSVQGEAISILLELGQAKDSVLRRRALGQLGNLPGSLKRGSPSRAVLNRALGDDKAPPEEGAEAAWSLRKVVEGDPELAEQLLVLPRDSRIFQIMSSAQ